MANQIKLKDTAISVGDTIKVYYSLKEADREKQQVFEGILIAIKGTGDNKMITVRRLTKEGIGVERIFPTISPFIKDVKIKTKGKTRRSKIYFIRGLSSRELREKLS